jgi:membrane protein implicated in regulation of membrane protease activity
MDLILIILATFWVWETFRAVMERFLPSVFALARPAHPILAAALPLYLLWPEWVSALAVAAVVGLMVVTVDRLFNTTPIEAYQRPRRSMTGGLPRLP